MKRNHESNRKDPDANPYLIPKYKRHLYGVNDDTEIDSVIPDEDYQENDDYQGVQPTPLYNPVGSIDERQSAIENQQNLNHYTDMPIVPPGQFRSPNISTFKIDELERQFDFLHGNGSQFRSDLQADSASQIAIHNNLTEPQRKQKQEQIMRMRK